MRISDWSSDVCSSDLHLGLVLRRGAEEDFADAIFLAALCLLEPFDNAFDLLVADIDEGFDTAAEEAAPRQLAPDLLFERGVGRSAGLQELGEVLGLALEVLSHAGEGLLHLGLGDRDLVAARFLNLELFVVEVTQNLHAQALAFRRIDLSAIDRKS